MLQVPRSLHYYFHHSRLNVVVASFQDGPQGSFPHDIHALVKSLTALYQGLVWMTNRFTDYFIFEAESYMLPWLPLQSGFASLGRSHLPWLSSLVKGPTWWGSEEGSQQLARNGDLFPSAMWVSLEAEIPDPGGPQDDWSTSQQLTCTLMRDLMTESLSSVTPRFQTLRNYMAY